MTRHTNTVNESVEINSDLNMNLNSLEKEINGLKKRVVQTQDSYETVIIGQQEQLELQLNHTMSEQLQERTTFDDTCDRRDDLETTKIEGTHELRKMNRNVPAQATDFDGQVDLLSGRIQLSI